MVRRSAVFSWWPSLRWTAFLELLILDFDVFQKIKTELFCSLYLIRIWTAEKRQQAFCEEVSVYARDMQIHLLVSLTISVVLKEA